MRSDEPYNVAKIARVTPAGDLVGDDEEDTKLLREILEQGRRYLRSFSWCESIRSEYFGGGVGGIFAVFLFEISTPRADIGNWIWIMAGDIPPAYLPLEARQRAYLR